MRVHTYSRLWDRTGNMLGPYWEYIEDVVSGHRGVMGILYIEKSLVDNIVYFPYNVHF